MQKAIPLFVFLTTPRSVRALLSQLLIAGAGADVRSDLCEEKGARASIALALGVNFYTFVMYLTAGAAPLDCWISCSSIHRAKRCPKFLLCVSPDVFLGQVSLFYG